MAGRAVPLTLRPMALGEREGKGPPRILEPLLHGEIPPEGRVGAGHDPLGTSLNGLMPAAMWLPPGVDPRVVERSCRRLPRAGSPGPLPGGFPERFPPRDGACRPADGPDIESNRTRPRCRRLSAHGVPLSGSAGGLSPPSPSSRVCRQPGQTSRRIAEDLHWADPRLASFLMGRYSLESLRGAREAGAIFENLVLLHLQVLSDLLRPPACLYY